MRVVPLILVFVLACCGAAGVGLAATPPSLLQSGQAATSPNGQALQRQRTALARMANVEVKYSKQGYVSLITGAAGTGIALSTPRAQEQAVELALEVKEKLADLLLASGSESLVLNRIVDLPALRPDLPRQRRISFSETINGLPVVSAYVFVDVEEPVGVIASLGAMFLQDRNLPSEPLLTASEAQQKYVQAMEATSRARPGTVEIRSVAVLKYFGASHEVQQGHLVWETLADYTMPDGRATSERVLTDARGGMVVWREPARLHSPSPEYKANRGCSAPGAKAEGVYRGCSGLPAVPASHAGERFCKDMRLIDWEPVYGATSYYGEHAPPAYGWAFAEAFVDGPYTSCPVELRERSMVRLKACNGCGCSDWSQPLIVDPKARCE